MCQRAGRDSKLYTEATVQQRMAHVYAPQPQCDCYKGIVACSITLFHSKLTAGCGRQQQTQLRFALVGG